MRDTNVKDERELLIVRMAWHCHDVPPSLLESAEHCHVHRANVIDMDMSVCARMHIYEPGACRQPCHSDY